MKPDFLEHLVKAREKLNLLKTVQCRMVYERVLIDPNSKLIFWIVS